MDSHEHNDEPPDIMKVRTFLNELSDYCLLKMDLDAYTLSTTPLRVHHTLNSHTLQKKVSQKSFGQSLDSTQKVCSKHTSTRASSMM